MISPIDVPTRMLLVDDDPAQVRLWQSVLRRGLDDHIEIEARTDPRSAMKYALTHCVDVLVTDLAMPEVSGLDLVRCVKLRNRCAQALLITGSSTTQSLLDSVDLGTVDYLLKPVETAVLVELAQQAIARLHRWRVALTETLRLAHAMS